MNSIEGLDRTQNLRVYRQGPLNIKRMFGPDKSNVVTYCKSICTEDKLCKGLYITGETAGETTCVREAFGQIDNSCSESGKKPSPASYSCYHLKSTGSSDITTVDRALIGNRFTNDVYSKVV